MQQFSVIQGSPNKNDQALSKPYMSLRGYIESYLETYLTIQPATITLQPLGVTGDRQTVTILPNTDRYSALVVNVSVDTEEDAVAIASVTSSYNFATFGNPGTSQILITKELVRQNIINPLELVLVARSEGLNLTFTNRTFLNIDVTVTAIIGMILTADLNDIMEKFGRKRIPT